MSDEPDKVQIERLKKLAELKGLEESQLDDATEPEESKEGEKPMEAQESEEVKDSKKFEQEEGPEEQESDEEKGSDEDESDEDESEPDESEPEESEPEESEPEESELEEREEDSEDDEDDEFQWNHPYDKHVELYDYYEPNLKFVEPTSYPLFEAAAWSRNGMYEKKEGEPCEGEGLGEEEELKGRQIDGEGVFHCFMHLPMEVRLMIWKFAMPEPRALLGREFPKDYFAYGYTMGSFEPEVLNEDIFDMPLANVCRESRAAVFDYGYTLLYPHVWRDVFRRSPWFCPGRDYVHKLPDFAITAMGLE
ncbi:hypothetical protein F5Y09DRAFT_352539 [Xylaria sp. FL1042]|nr:hypothetical protein F5Y09DRAFT_352539 [Xylaria sp. FL1042]